MLDSRRISINTSQRGTALTARERLLRDKHMRRNKPNGATASHRHVPHVTVTFSTMDGGANRPAQTYLLSPAEQQRRAIQVAQSFRHCVVSEITYLSERRLAVAVARPIATYSRPPGLPQRICVDADGNVSIYPSAQTHAPKRQLAIDRVMLAAGGLLTILATVVFLALT